jgi:hypothetical protein
MQWWGTHLPMGAALGTTSGLLSAGLDPVSSFGVGLLVGLAAGARAGLPAGGSAAGEAGQSTQSPAVAAAAVAAAPVAVPRQRRPLPRRAGEQGVREVAELSAASDEIAGRFRRVADALEALRGSIGEISDGATSATGSAGTAVARARAAAQEVDSLLEASRQIGDVTGVIASITDQTRTLALNATIEAARAGAAGRGFAVVAHEVKELAAATARAAQSIAVQVQSVQDGTRSAAQAISGVTEVLAEVAESQGGVCEAVGRQSTATAAISANVEEAARRSAQVAELVARRVEAEQRTFVEGALEGAHDLLDAAGGIHTGECPVEWQVTWPDGTRRRIALPELRLGTTRVTVNADPAVPSPVVDEVKRRVGGTATLFQRLDAEGAMLRVATNVTGPDGRRAVGTVLPVRAADGTPSPVIAAVLAGETYRGEAKVLGRDFVTAYAPLTENGELVGVLYVGLPKQARSAEQGAARVTSASR